jgi:hypothetical protein
VEGGFGNKHGRDLVVVDVKGNSGWAKGRCALEVGVRGMSLFVLQIPCSRYGWPTRKKPGKPSAFQGERAKFLQEYYPIYADTSKHGKVRNIWDAVFLKYWGLFPWQLPLTQDPNPDDLTDYALRLESPEEAALKVKIVHDTEGVSRVIFLQTY